MAIIYEGQSLKLKLDINITLVNSDIDEALIKYQKMGEDTVNEWVATVDDGQEIIYKDIPYSTLESGQYKFWAHITYLDGKVVIGKSVKLKIRKEGE